MLRSLLAVLVAILWAVTAASAARLASFDVRLRLSPGARIVEFRYLDDRIEWKLPRKRLQPFIRAGVVIHEERHTTAISHAVIVSGDGVAASLRGTIALVTLDVPRHTRTTASDSFSARLTERNVPQPLDHPDIEDAATIGLPAKPVAVGTCWDSRLPVTTELGSGSARFHHCVAERDGDLLAISVHADGTITGSEYHLPKLLPGTIRLDGIAWYDLDLGLITQESYRIHDSLLKPAENEQIGFDQVLDVDVTSRPD